MICFNPNAASPRNAAGFRWLVSYQGTMAHGLVAAASLQIAAMRPAHPDGAAWVTLIKFRDIPDFLVFQEKK